MPGNPDRVTPPVVSGGGAGLVLAVAARSIIDRYVNPADRELWWNLFQAALFLLPLAGAWLGGLRAKRDVTPIRPGDQPRNWSGAPLVPVGYAPPMPTQLARLDDLPRVSPPGESQTETGP